MFYKPFITRCKNCDELTYENLQSYGYCMNCSYSEDVDNTDPWSVLTGKLKSLLDLTNEEIRILEAY